MKLLAVVAMLVAALSACGGHDGPSTGKVLDKSHDEAWIQTIQECVDYGKYGCLVYAPVIIPHEAVWSLDLDNGTAKGWHDVSESQYDNCTVGQSFNGARCT